MKKSNDIVAQIVYLDKREVLFWDGKISFAGEFSASHCHPSKASPAKRNIGHCFRNRSH